MLIINKYVYNLLWNAFYCQRVIVDTMIHLKLKSPVGDFNFYQSNIWTEYLYFTRLVMRAELLKCWSTKVKHFPTEWLIFSALKHLQVRVWPRPPGSYLLSDVRRRRRNVSAPHLNESWSQDESAGLQITWETVFSCSSSKKTFYHHSLRFSEAVSVKLTCYLTEQVMEAQRSYTALRLTNIWSCFLNELIIYCRLYFYFRHFKVRKSSFKAV